MPSLLSDSRIRTAFDQLIPGLLNDIESLEGEFIEDRLRPVSTFTPQRAHRYQAFHISLAYKFEDRSLLRIEVRMKDEAGSYSVTKHSFHYGPDYLDPADHFFRIDYAIKVDPLHIHIRNHPGHTEPHQCSPDIRNIDARRFVAIVKEFRKTRVQPFRRLP